MTEHPLPLITFYTERETYQHSLIETIAPLSSEHLAFPDASHHWTIGMVVQHMVTNRVWWFQVWMGEGSPDHQMNCLRFVVSSAKMRRV